MSKFDWRNGFSVGVTIGGGLTIIVTVWTIGLNYCPQSPCNQYRGNAEQPTNDENWLPNPFGSDVTADLHPANQDDHPDYYSHQDLAAQEVMAEATKWIVILSGISLVVAVVGSCAIIWTLFESRKASSAAIEANRIARAQNRPWVLLKHRRECRLKVTSAGLMAEWGRAIVNEGGTPAFSVNTRAEIASTPKFVYDDELQDFIDSVRIDATLLRKPTVLFPTEKDEIEEGKVYRKFPNRYEAFYLFFVTTYRLWDAEDADIGYEAKVFEIVTGQGPDEDGWQNCTLSEMVFDRETA